MTSNDEAIFEVTQTEAEPTTIERVPSDDELEADEQSSEKPKKSFFVRLSEKLSGVKTIEDFDQEQQVKEEAQGDEVDLEELASKQPGTSASRKPADSDGEAVFEVGEK